ncbi:glycoside hydrolase [Phyllobacterium brassicacearum]|uniref:Lysozyme n=1 Tax=Phyllobacterium brassicacearum TaxID=314235 RepID=A0A2P7BQ96_9HYPH|nr:lysozyme [Phyllobacterium brassicacearum]PSH68630.1 glycoside hydrolase [Phyllobacterium brassicacearum]TDQ24182.1 lysozyme [Phyllobacterium brassicacearum]
MNKRAKVALASGLGLIALTATYLTEPWENTENLAYYDRLGKVWTVCTGETKGVKQGDYYTDAECKQMLYTRLENDYRKPLQKCVKGFDAMPLSVQASMLDLSYNVGVTAVCNSTAARLASAKDWRGSCEAMTRFNRAGGKVVRGLKLRREDGDLTRIGERELCLGGLKG